MPEPGQKELEAAAAIFGVAGPAAATHWAARKVAQALAAAREEGRFEGIVEEGAGCDAHCKAAAKAERERILGELRRRSKAFKVSVLERRGTFGEQRWWLDQLDEIEKEGTQP